MEERRFNFRAMKPISSVLVAVGSLVISAGLLHPASAATLFSDDVEGGINGWTTSGLWHLQESPENVFISTDFNPSLISLPDDGFLPEAYSGDAVWWYGADDGTFMGDYDDTEQWDKNGGWSDDANYGDLISPTIDLTGSTQARLSFWSWWEIEGVDVDRYDLMEVQVSTDGGETYVDLGTGLINPENDVDGESWKPYSSGGLGQVGEWEQHVFDLSNYVGESVVLKFTFDTVDEKYNAFRGWLIDDVEVTDEALAAPQWKQTVQAVRQCISGSEIQNSAQFYLPKEQIVEVTTSDDAFAYITAFGSADWIWDSSVAGDLTLPQGSYVLWVDFSGGEGCPHADIAAELEAKAGPQVEAIQVDQVLVIHGDNFVSGATVEFISASNSAAVSAAVDDGVAADDVSVVGAQELHVVVPFSLEDGRYDVRITNPDGQTKLMKKAVRITTDDAPVITSVDTETVDNDTDTTIVISGIYFAAGTMAAVGNVPLENVVIDEFGTTVTGTLPAGIRPGFRNVEVLNSDGQNDVLVGGIEVVDAGGTPFVPAGEFVGEPDQVTGVAVTLTSTTSAEVSWTAAERAESYKVQLRKSNGTKIKTFRVSSGEIRTIGNTYLDSGKNYKVRVRAFSAYGSGAWSEYVSFETE